MTTQPEQDNEYCQPSSGKDEHDQMRKAPIDIGGKEMSTEKLMSPQSQEPKDYDAG